jgi:hypothetical protein
MFYFVRIRIKVLKNYNIVFIVYLYSYKKRYSYFEGNKKYIVEIFFI